MGRTIAVFAAILLAGLGSATAAGAQEVGQVREPARAFPAEIVLETRQRAAGGLPDGLVATGSSEGGVVAAWYGQPTSRYAHGVLGDAVEAGQLNVRLSNGQVLRHTLPQSEVYEDRYPRIADLDSDGKSEIITIRASLALGASVTVYAVNGNVLREAASTGFIGTPNRWLNIAGIEPFAGSRTREIAFVKTPHIGGTLFFYRYDGRSLRQVAAMSGFSNHEIGSRELRLSAIADIDGDGRPELALPSADRRSLRMVELTPGGVREIGRAMLESRVTRAIAVTTGETGETVFVTGLEDGSQVAISRR